MIYNFTVDYPLSYEQLYPETEIAIYPNPASNQFTIEGKGVETSEIKIYNQLGQTIQMPLSKEAGKVSVNSSHVVPGIYFVIIQSENGEMSTRKVVIE